jgi:hypothetical protein
MTNQKRRCNGPDHVGPRFLPVEKFHKRGRRNGIQDYDGWCKVCRNAKLREQYAQEGRSGGWNADKKKAYLRARSRTFTRLTKLVPDLYQMVLKEELAKEPEWW